MFLNLHIHWQGKHVNMKSLFFFLASSLLSVHADYIFFFSVSSLGDLLSSVAHRSLKHQDGDFKRMILSFDSTEFQAVKMQFHLTMPPDKAQISKIEKIENNFLLERYNR